ncbi:hypothetical protein [uncultured Eudoraea sp.]|uniref:hypothetical protein n=1 Tax=uncultured Eudoraea sp. TaxID=1035614 RepID=UPI00262AFC13|nr:hypothetical protein [uncultured Eudoraea sp.]
MTPQRIKASNLVFLAMMATVIVMFVTALASCKGETKFNTDKAYDGKIETYSNALNGKVEAVIDDTKLLITEFNTKNSTSVVFLKDGLQFKILDNNNRSVLVNMYAPGLLDRTPFTINRIIESLSAEEASKSNTKGKLEILLPGKKASMEDIKMLYKGSMTLTEASDQKIVVAFKGSGVNGDTEVSKRDENQFPMEGIIEINNFEIYDMRN